MALPDTENERRALCDALSSLHHTCFTWPRPWSSSEFSDLLTMDGAVLIQREGPAFALGRVVLNEVELLTIAVSPDHRAQGIGRAVLDDFERQSRLLGAETSYLEVAESNHAAIALYRSAGYTQTGRRPKYYRQPDGKSCAALVYSKALQKA